MKTKCHLWGRRIRNHFRLLLFDSMTELLEGRGAGHCTAEKPVFENSS